ncbi:hypothetical protein A2U01_0077589, partial [Trifolium medium]|nr:hypothetical protein [Trifolium medium]
MCRREREVEVDAG